MLPGLRISGILPLSGVPGVAEAGEGGGINDFYLFQDNVNSPAVRSRAWT